MKLTHQNYFSTENKYLSNSKISDWKKGDKQFFYKKHISHEIKKTVTDPMIIGSAVDCYLTEGKEAFNEKYIIVNKRSRKNITIWENQLNQAMYDQIETMCEKLIDTRVYKDIQKDYFAQEVLYDDMDIGVFKGLSGIPDWYKIIENDKEIILEVIDLKTTKSANIFKYHYSCLDLNYYTQQAMYQMLLEKKYFKDTKKKVIFDSIHLVLEKDSDNIFNSFLFRLNQERIEKEKVEIMKTIEEIKNEKDFKTPSLNWSNIREIGEEIDN